MDITKYQAVKNAQSAFVAALDAGIEEEALIEAVFDASNEWSVENLGNNNKKEQAEACQEKYSASK